MNKTFPHVNSIPEWEPLFILKSKLHHLFYSIIAIHHAHFQEYIHFHFFSHQKPTKLFRSLKQYYIVGTSFLKLYIFKAELYPLLYVTISIHQMQSSTIIFTLFFFHQHQAKSFPPVNGFMLGSLFFIFLKAAKLFHLLIYSPESYSLVYSTFPLYFDIFREHSLASSFHSSSCVKQSMNISPPQRDYFQSFCALSVSLCSSFSVYWSVRLFPRPSTSRILGICFLPQGLSVCICLSVRRV